MNATNDREEMRWLAAIALVVVGALFVGYWGLTHRPVRSLNASLPTNPVAVESSSGGAPLPLPTPTLGPADVYVYTLGGETVCSGYPVGDLGYQLRCAVPEGIRLFRVVDSAGNSTLAVRYSEEVVIRVGDETAR